MPGIADPMIAELAPPLMVGSSDGSAPDVDPGAEIVGKEIWGRVLFCFAIGSYTRIPVSGYRHEVDCCCRRP